MNYFSEFKATAAKHLAANPDDSIYLLVDYGGMTGLPREIKKHKTDWASLFDETRESGAFLAAPILILLGRNSSLSLNKKLTKWISERADDGSSVIMMASSLSIAELRRQLTMRLDLKISGNMDAMLRFFDARILAQLIEILSSEQIEILCGPAKKWWYLDRLGQVVEIEGEFEFIEGCFNQIDLSEEQEFALIKASEPDQILHLLISAMPQIKLLMPKNRHRFMADNILSASRLDLCSISDLVLYSAIATLLGENFYALPYWQAALSDVSAKRISFADAVNGCEEVVWEVE